MSLKFKILHELNGDVITSPLKGWWRNNRGESQKISHEMYFHLLKEGWQTEVIGNEVILYEPNSLNGEPSFIRQAETKDLYESDLVVSDKVIEFNNDDFSIAFLNFKNSYNQLKKLGLLRNQKDVTGQLGEWVASKLFNAQISENGINKDWDLKDQNGILYQVKSHAKSPTTPARWSKVDYSVDAKIDFLVIVIFDQNYRLNELYKVPFKEVLKKRTNKFVLNWSVIIDFKEKNLVEFLRQNNLDFLLT
jgi:hypothetical protein